MDDDTLSLFHVNICINNASSVVILYPGSEYIYIILWRVTSGRSLTRGIT
jgi:hypothetical protein